MSWSWTRERMDQIFRMPYLKWSEGARFLKYSSLESTWAAPMILSAHMKAANLRNS
ncbi:hypothetical protein ACMD2_19247 [Ananas comosus]|uniref:Uncharacterized protein n=1 Tax=Ananas comosus TaxID=4615 RepID=A0A199VG78_ANACO|nr:hypothetical protein ACMD2_19247 [Ananas comosus]